MDIGFVWDETKYQTVLSLTQKGDGLMNIMEDDAFDYQAYMRETPPDPAQIRRGTAARQQRLDAAIKRQMTRIDPDILQQFGQLAAEGQSAEQLINQALRQWLAADGIREMVRAEIQLAIRQSLSASQSPLESLPA